MTIETVNEHFPWEGAFILDDFRNLRLSRGINAVKSYAFLTRQIQRRPQELAFHVCRIKCALQMRDEEAVYAAVLDLFSILDDKGLALRKRMLSKVADSLSSQIKTELGQVLSGQLSAQSLPYCACSVLHEGMSVERVDLGLPTPDKQVTALDPVNTARLCLESGQIEQAQEILESQLEIEPEREEVKADLLEIYCATRNASSFKASYQLLQFRGCLDNAWKDAVSFFATAT